MSGLDPNIGGDKRDPFKDLEQLRQSLEEEKSKLFAEGETGWLALIINSFQKMLSVFSNKEKQIISQAEIAFVERDIGILKQAFRQIDQTDLSRDLPFLEKLSHTWRDLLAHTDLLYPNTRSLPRQAIDRFIYSCNHYPTGEGKSLGFYLSLYKGEEWIPFPFMEIVEKLHLESKVNTTTSQLETWITMLEETERTIR